MTKSNLQLKHLKKSVSHGNIRQVIEELIEFTEGSTNHMTTEIYHVAARYRQLEAEKLRGHIALQDYKLEYKGTKDQAMICAIWAEGENTSRGDRSGYFRNHRSQC